MFTKRRGKRKDTAKDVRAARKARKAADRKVSAATTVQSFRRGQSVRRIVTRDLQTSVTKSLHQMASLRTRLVKVHGPAFAFPSPAVNTVVKKYLLLVHFRRKLILSNPQLVTLGVLVAGHVLTSVRCVSTSQSLHDVPTLKRFATFCLKTCTHVVIPAHGRLLVECAVLLAHRSPEVLISFNIKHLFLYVRSSTALILPSSWWNIVFKKVAGCSDDVYMSFQRGVLSAPGRVQANLNILLDALRRLAATKQKQELLNKLHQCAWPYTIPKKTPAEGENDENDEECLEDEEDTRRNCRRAMVHNLVWLSVVLRSYFYHRHRNRSHPIIQQDMLLLIESLQRRAEVLSKHDCKRSDADTVQVISLYGRLLRQLKQTDAGNDTKAAAKKSSLYVLRTKFATTLMTRTRALCGRKMWSEALKCTQRVGKMSGKKIPFPLWKESKERSALCQKQIQERSGYVLQVVKKMKSQQRKDKEAKEQRRRDAIARMHERRRQQQSGEDKDVHVRLSLKEKRQRQQQLRKEVYERQQREKERIRQRRIEAARQKAYAFQKTAAERAAKKRQAQDQASVLRQDKLQVVYQRVMEEAEKESARVAQKVIVFQEERANKLRKEEEERQEYFKKERIENQRKRKEAQSLKHIEVIARKKKEKEDWKKEDAEMVAKGLKEEEEKKKERKEEMEFENEMKRMKEREKEMNPNCLFCGFRKESVDQLCTRCHGDIDKEEREKNDSVNVDAVDVVDVVGLEDEEESFALWDYDDDVHNEEEAAEAAFFTSEGTITIMDLETELGTELPDEWCCPLTLEIFRDPVIMMEDQQVYERSAIEGWFQSGNNTSPLTNMVIESTPTFVPDEDMKDMIDATVREILLEREEFKEMERQRRIQSQKEFRLSDPNGYLEVEVNEEAEEEGEGEEGETKQDGMNQNVSSLVRNADDATMAMWTSSLLFSSSPATPRKDVVHDNGGDAMDIDQVGTHATLVQTIQSSSFLWVVLTVTAGRFAGGVFRRGVLIDHKTFSRYTTRRKQGGSQSAADGGGGGHAKSAGATLRRYNELALHQEVQELLSDEWSIYLEEAEKVWISASHTAAKLLYSSAGGKKQDKRKNQGAVSKQDARVLKVPFQTGRPTLEECKRICRCLATCWVVPSKYQDVEEDDEGNDEYLVDAPKIRRGIPPSEILPMETKRRRNVVERVLEEGYGEILLWEVKEKTLTGSGWRNEIRHIDEDEGGSFLFF